MKNIKNDAGVKIDTNLGTATIKLVQIKEQYIREIQFMIGIKDVDAISANDVVEYLNEKGLIDLNDCQWMQCGRGVKALTVLNNDGTVVRYDYSVIDHMKERTSVQIPLIQFEKGDINYILDHQDQYGLTNINQVGAEAIVSYLDDIDEIDINNSQWMSCNNKQTALTVLNSDGSCKCYDFSIIEKMKKCAKKNK